MKISFNKKPEKETKQSILHGTGLTQKHFAKQQTEDKKQTSAIAKLLRNKHTPDELGIDTIPATVIESSIDGVMDQASVDRGELPEKLIEETKTIQSVSHDINLDQSQISAIDGLLAQQFGCLIGAAGTGKTTIEKMLVETIKINMQEINLRAAEVGDPTEKPERLGLPICFGAFTGKAVQQMKKALDPKYHPQCKTLHSHLGFKPNYFDIKDETTGLFKQTMRFEPTFDQYNKLPYKVYFVDETGMLNVPLMNQLFDAMLPEARIYFIGDINQLAPPMGRSALAHAMLKWPTFELTTIHRQKMPDGSLEVHPIIAASQAVLRGEWPKIVPGVFDMIQFPSDWGSSKVRAGAIKYIKHAHGKNQFDPLRDAMVVPQNVGPIGQLEFNEKLVTYFNPTRTIDGVVVNRRTFIKTGKETVALSIGDKVMLLQNDNDRLLTNGMMGVVTNLLVNGDYKGKHDSQGMNITQHEELDFDDIFAGLGDEVVDLEEQHTAEREENLRQASHILVVRFDVPSINDDGEEIPYKDVEFKTVGQYKSLQHSYTMTCHKLQGSEHHTVVILVHSANAVMLCREWLYTAITRGVEHVVILYNNNGMVKALANQRIQGKTLDEKIKAFNELTQDETGSELPNLPEPVEL